MLLLNDELSLPFLFFFGALLPFLIAKLSAINRLVNMDGSMEEENFLTIGYIIHTERDVQRISSKM